MVEYATKLEEFEQAFDTDTLNDEGLNKFYTDTMNTRLDKGGIPPTHKLYNACVTPKTKNTHLFLGHVGCGKSTELRKLKQRFEEESGMQVSVINCSTEADLNGLTYGDLLILMGKHLCYIAEKVGCELDETLIRKIATFWSEKEILKVLFEGRNEVFKDDLHTPQVADLIPFFLGLSNELRFGFDTRKVMRETIKRSSFQWIGYMGEVVDAITKKMKGKQPILIFEEIDKATDLEKIWEIFSNPVAEMPLPVIYTFPISLSYHTRFAGVKANFGKNVHILPMIKIREIEGTRYQPGIDMMTSIVERRADISLFETDEEGSTLDFLIEKTGGVLRDLFHCVSDAALRADYNGRAKIERADVKAVTIQLSSSLQRLIETGNYPVLKKIHSDMKYKKENENKEMLLDLMQSLVVLEYNGERWHDLHPLIEDFLRGQGELS